MIRRSALAAGVLVAALAISSCSTVNRSNTVAEVNGVQLSPAELLLLTKDSTAGDGARTEITKWLTAGVLGGDVTNVTSDVDLTTRLAKAESDLSAPFMTTAESRYAQGLDGSPVLCLAAIPLAATTAPETVLGELAAGSTFADTAKKYSSDSTLAASGGIIQDQNGTSCLAPEGFKADLLASMKTAGAAPGKTVVIDLTSTKVVMLMRPFTELTTNDRVSLVQNEIGGEVKARLAAAKIYVNPHYGRWDPKTVAVVALGQS